ncbi:MAG: hypothetical protein ACRD8U_00220 [Pyrinomonadaceae bacterium]
MTIVRRAQTATIVGDISKLREWQWLAEQRSASARGFRSSGYQAPEESAVRNPSFIALRGGRFSTQPMKVLLAMPLAFLSWAMDFYFPTTLLEKGDLIASVVMLL